MTTNPNAPLFVLAAITRIYDQLPALVGADAWEALQPQVDAHIATLKEQPDAFLESTQLVGLLAQHEPARQAFTDEMRVQETVTHNLAQPLDEIGLPADDNLLAVMYAAIRWDVDPDTIPAPGEDVRTRGISMTEGGISGGKSMKFRNLDLDYNKLLTLSAGFLLTGDDMLEKPRPFIIAAGLLVMVGTLLSEMSVKVEKQEATVFWGMIQTGKLKPTAAEIASATNTEREKYGLPALSDAQIHHSLTQLAQLKSIEQTGDTYRIIEDYTIKD